MKNIKAFCMWLKLTTIDLFYRIKSSSQMFVTKMIGTDYGNMYEFDDYFASGEGVHMLTPQITSSNISCGAYQLSNLFGITSYGVEQRVARYAWEVARILVTKQSRIHTFLMFSDSTKNNNGEELYKFITSYSLGSVTKTKVKPNRNTGYPISVYVWETDKDAILKFYEDGTKFINHYNEKNNVKDKVQTTTRF